MTKRLVLLVVVCALIACRQGSAPAPVTDVRPLLWSVEKAGKASYLLGTMHAGIEAERLPPVVWKAVDDARVLVVEVDLSQSVPQMRTSGSLSIDLGPAYWKKLEDAVGVDGAGRLDAATPLGAASTLAQLGLPRTEPMDWKLVLRARATGKPIVYLETLEHQLAGIAKWMDVRALRTMLDDMSLVRAIGQQMLVAFVSGDESQILAVTEREHAAWLAGGRTQVEYDEQMADVLYRRNASWMPAIEKIVTEGGGFIAVGAAHTVGPRSVVELLVQRGYTVTRITR